VNKSVTGEYYSVGKDYRDTIKLNTDHSFELRMQEFETDAKCKGMWHYISRDTILLNCDSAKDLETRLSSGDMSNQARKIVIITHSKIKLEQVILTKIK